MATLFKGIICLHTGRPVQFCYNLYKQIIKIINILLFLSYPHPGKVSIAPEQHEILDRPGKIHCPNNPLMYLYIVRDMISIVHCSLPHQVQSHPPGW